MDERNDARIPETDGGSGAPREDAEVVLAYRRSPQPVVEYYVQPMPLPGARRRTEEAAAEERRHRSRRGLRIFLWCLAALAVFTGAVAGAAALLRSGFFFGANEPYYSDGFSLDRGERRGGDRSAAETRIARYPTGDGTRLTYSETHGETMTIQEIYARVNPCTVTVVATLTDESAQIGTGVIFSQNGHILTNAHVITGGQDCFVVLDTGRSFEASLIGFDEEQDLAVIKIDAHGLPTAEFGDSDALSVGDPVYAIGNPLGVELRGTLTNGIVSAINRDVEVDNVIMTLIQTNAALNNGNSGGPLINEYGQVVGINTMKMGSSSAVSVEGLGFAIPISQSAYMINDLIAWGEVRGEPVIGVSVRPEGVALPTGETGVLIMEVVPGGPGEQAGLLPGDYIVLADGEALSSSNDLLRIRRRYGAGETLRLTVRRGDTLLETDVTLAEAQD